MYEILDTSNGNYIIYNFILEEIFILHAPKFQKASSFQNFHVLFENKFSSFSTFLVLQASFSKIWNKNGSM